MYILMNKEEDSVLLEEGKLSGKLYSMQRFWKPRLYKTWVIAHFLSKLKGLVCISIKFHDLATPEGFITLHKRNYNYEYLRLKTNGNLYKISIKGYAPFTIGKVDEDGSVYIDGLGNLPLDDFELVEF